MLVRCTHKLDRVQFAHCAARAVAARDPRCCDLGDRSVGLLQRCLDVIGVLLEGNQLGVPAHGDSTATQRVTHQPFVVILTKDQKKRIRTQVATDIADRDSSGAPPFGPQVGARRAFAELESAIDDAELRVDLERARLHAQCPRLQSRPWVPVDDQRTYAASRELIREHQPGRPGADDEDVSVHVHVIPEERKKQRENPTEH